MLYWVFLLTGLLLSGISYAKQPLGLPPLPVPADNPQSAAKIDLGRRLFNDKRFSADATISCASCHHADQVFTDGLPVAKGIGQQIGARNAPTLVNAAYFTYLFHDGRANSLEDQVLGPLTSPVEQGLKDLHLILKVVRQDKSYQSSFNTVFKIPPQAITMDHVVKAIASYERSLIAADSAFDHYLFGRDRSRLSPSAARGYRLFRRKGNCANCHEITWNHALFTDNRFYNIGVGSKKLQAVLDAFISQFQAGKSTEAINLTKIQRSELGRFNVTKVIADIGKFKTPSLRNIALTGPYMHDGSMQTLKEVIEYYDKGGEKNRFLDAAIFPLKLTQQEKQDLLSFLQALTSPQFIR